MKKYVTDGNNDLFRHKSGLEFFEMVFIWFFHP